LSGSNAAAVEGRPMSGCAPWFGSVPGEVIVGTGAFVVVTVPPVVAVVAVAVVVVVAFGVAVMVVVVVVDVASVGSAIDDLTPEPPQAATTRAVAAAIAARCMRLHRRFGGPA
jgi:hypothetical protein